MTILACDVGGTQIKVGIVRDGAVLARGEIPAEAKRGLAMALERIAEAAALLQQQAGLLPQDLVGVGLAFPGIIEPGTDRILSTPAGKFDDSKSLDTHGRVRSLLGLPVHICNDANAALVGEWRYGAARGCRSVVMMTLGTGVGSAVIIDGVPLRGTHGQAGCLGGHMLARVDGTRCPCGALGCVESEASTWALPAQARTHAGYAQSSLSREFVVDYRAVFEHATQGDALATELRDRGIRVWAAAIVSLIHAYDPERVVLGGGIMRSAEWILPKVRQYVAQHAWTPWGQVEVVPAALGNDAGMRGVACLAEQQFGQRTHRDATGTA